METEQTQCSETLAHKIQTPGNYPEDSIQHSEQGESFKSRIVVRHHTLHNISNENGETVANYAISSGMFLISTNFQHKKIHTGTWISPDHQTIDQIDHVMVSKEKMR